MQDFAQAETTLSKVATSLKDRQFAIFILCCGFAAIVNVTSRWAINFIVSYRSAIVLAYLVGMCTAFFLCKRFVFDAAETGRTRKEFSYFFIVNLAGMAQTFVVSVLLAEWLFPRVDFLWHPEVVAHSVGVAFPTLSSFLGHKFLSFRK